MSVTHTPYICNCAILDMPQVVTDGIGCGKCKPADMENIITPESVTKAFSRYRDLIERDDADTEET